MAYQVSDYLVNACLTPEQIEDDESQRNSNALSAMTPEDWTEIDKFLHILQNQPETRTEVADQTQHGIKRKRSCSESSSTSTLTTTSTSQSDASNPSTSKKRPRAKICGLQLQILEETFAVNQFVVGKERRLLAERVGLTDSQIGNWFEYRRRKMRRAQNRVSEDQTKSSSPTSSVHVDLSSMVKQEQFNSFPSTSSAITSDATSSYSSTSSTAWNLEDSMFRGEEIDFVSTFFGSAMSAESQISVVSEGTSSRTGSLEESAEFLDPHSLASDFSLLPIFV